MIYLHITRLNGKNFFLQFFNIFNIKTGIIFFYLKQIEMSVLLLFLHIWH